MSWYEYGLHVERYTRAAERKESEIKERRLHTGIIWATLMNTHYHRRMGDKTYTFDELFGGDEKKVVDDGLEFSDLVKHKKIKKDGK